MTPNEEEAAELAAYFDELDAQAELEAERRADRSFPAQPGDMREFVEEAECPHGLSLWLCADPINHYPADRPSY